MKASSLPALTTLFKASLALALGSLLPLSAATLDGSNPLLTPRTAANTLQLVVAAPASLNLVGADNVAGTLTHLVKSVFQDSGFSGQMNALVGHEAAQADLPTLEIYLLNWRITGAGSVECTFTASLTTAGVEENLGLFEGTSLPMFGLRDAFNRAAAFDQAATDAIDNLYGDLRSKNLLSQTLLD
jgi:hypothetical protein